MWLHKSKQGVQGLSVAVPYKLAEAFIAYLLPLGLACNALCVYIRLLWLYKAMKP